MQHVNQLKKVDSGRTRTYNLLLRRQAPYPLGHRAFYWPWALSRYEIRYDGRCPRYDLRWPSSNSNEQGQFYSRMCIGITISEIRFWVGLKFFENILKLKRRDFGDSILILFLAGYPKDHPKWLSDRMCRKL